jgi:hypothetical protein
LHISLGQKSRLDPKGYASAALKLYVMCFSSIWSN